MAKKKAEEKATEESPIVNETPAEAEAPAEKPKQKEFIIGKDGNPVIPPALVERETTFG